MNREILFRGKRELDGKWIYGLYSDDYVYETEFPCIMPLRSGNDYEDWSVIRETVGQYTGLTDKNGKKIFEGDIVKGVAYSTDFIGVITWIDEIAGFGVRYFNSRRTPTAWENSSILKMIQQGHKDQFAAEVVGNIHDNPELLEVQHE